MTSNLSRVLYFAKLEGGKRRRAGPFSERHKREDAFDCDWERFAFYDYQSLAAEEDEAAQEGELMEVGDWVD